MDVKVLIASCCNREKIEKKVQPLFSQMQIELPELKWGFLDLDVEPELAVKYAVPSTPAILIDGKLEFIGLPNNSKLESKIRELALAAP